MASLYKKYAKSWDICVSVLTFLILICSKMSDFGWISNELQVDKGEECGPVVDAVSL